MLLTYLQMRHLLNNTTLLVTTSPYDEGILLPICTTTTMVRAEGQDNFQPKINFKTRYGLIHLLNVSFSGTLVSM